MFKMINEHGSKQLMTSNSVQLLNYYKKGLRLKCSSTNMISHQTSKCMAMLPKDIAKCFNTLDLLVSINNHSGFKFEELKPPFPELAGVFMYAN